ncbi:MAG TPA: energy transducer TonB [Pyrinomonadaceae bacterium]|nr:energy transducer TonB [Pyrinomonadaceae bacterium]
MESHSAKPAYEYQPTIIETRFLIERLAIQIALLRQELKRNGIEFKRNPRKFLTCLIRQLLAQLKIVFTTPYVLRASSTAITVVACLVVVVLLVERSAFKPGHEPENVDQAPEVVVLNFAKPTPKDDSGFGRNGNGRVGLQNNKGEGSGAVRQPAQGGGSGGDRDPLPAQVGEVPPTSQIQAAIPIAPPINPPALPVAGIDIDPALWQDLKAPVYGDPMSKSEAPSKGPGTSGGIGSNDGLGVGDGRGHGFGPGPDGNTGGGTKQIGCCGPGGSAGEGYGSGGHCRLYSGNEVEQRARLLFKPEPQYTEEARRNQITGTVVLRVVFESSGEVVQIRAVRTLPFGLTERAIAAARQIKFAPAMKSGHAVSVHMQLEYNFNLY